MPLIVSRYSTRRFLVALSQTPGGGGGTDSLSLSTNCETTAPLFGQRTAPVLLPPNLQPPLFMDNQAQPLEISVKWCIFCITYIIFYQIMVLKGFKNKWNAYNCYLMWNIGCKYSDSPPFIQYDFFIFFYSGVISQLQFPNLGFKIAGFPPLFSHLGSRQPPLRSDRTAVCTLFQTEYPPTRGSDRPRNSTYRPSFAIVVAGEGVEGPKLHPALTHLLSRLVPEATDVCASLRIEITQIHPHHNR